MRVYSKSRWFYIVLIGALAYYLAISVGANLCHNHEPGFHFHDDCPACQWEVLYQDDFSQADQILSVLETPLFLIGYEQYIQLLVCPSDDFRLSCSPRAPPLPA